MYVCMYRDLRKVAAATAMPSPGAGVACARARAVNEAQLRYSPRAKKGAAAALGTDQPAAALGWKWKSSDGLFLDRHAPKCKWALHGKTAMRENVTSVCMRAPWTGTRP